MRFTNIIATFIFLFSLNTSAKIVNIKICSLDTGFGMYTSTNGDGLWQKIVKDSVKDLDVTLTFIYAPRGRCLLKVKKGGIDAFYAAITEDKKSYLQYPLTKNHVEDLSRTIGYIQYKIYKKKDSQVMWDGKKFTNLGTHTIGVQRGLQIEQSLRDNYVKVDGDLVATPEQNLRKLAMGRIIAAAIEEQQADDFIKKSGLQGIIKFEKNYSHSDVHLAFSNYFYQEHHDLVEKIWDNIKVSKKLNPKNNPASISINSNLQMASI